MSFIWKLTSIILVVIVVLALGSLLLNSCGLLTANQRAKNWGGRMVVDLPEDEKLVMVTWKNDKLWYLTKPMSPDDVPETYNFQEKSRWGLIEGTVILKERCK